MRPSPISEVRGFIVNNFLMGRGDKLTDDSSFLELGIVDSTGMLELVSHLEQTYKIEITDDELVPSNLDSINQISNYLCRKLPDHDVGPLSIEQKVCSDG